MHNGFLRISLLADFALGILIVLTLKKLNMMHRMPASNLPAEIKLWFEAWFKQELKPTDTITAWAYTPDPTNSYWDYMKKMQPLRDARLNAITTKMRALGMSEEDITLVLHGGYKEGESYFLRRKAVDSEKKTETAA